MKVMCWVKTGYRKQSRAYFYAQSIIREFKHTTHFLLCNGKKISIKQDDIISIEVCDMADSVCKPFCGV